MPDYIEFNIRPKVPSQRGYKVLDGNLYDVLIQWRGTADTGPQKWYMDLTQVADSSISIKGKALLQGRNLLGAHGYDHILGELWVEDTAGTTDDPDYDGMGGRWRLRYYPITS